MCHAYQLNNNTAIGKFMNQNNYTVEILKNKHIIALNVIKC